MGMSAGSVDERVQLVFLLWMNACPFPAYSVHVPHVGHVSGALERNLIPRTAELQMSSIKEEVQPVQVSASGVAFPHPEKVIKNKVRGVNTRSFGYGGEDAYFYCHGRWVRCVSPMMAIVHANKQKLCGIYITIFNG